MLYFIQAIISNFVESVLEIKIKIFLEIGFLYGFSSAMFTDPQFLNFFFSPGTWMTKTFIEGIIQGIGTGVGAVMLAYVLKFIRWAYLKLKFKLYGKRSANP